MLTINMSTELKHNENSPINSRTCRAVIWLTAVSAGILLLFLTAGQGLAETETYIVAVEDIGYYPHYDFKEGEFIGFAREFLDAFANWSKSQ